MTTPASSNRFKGVGFQPVATPSTPTTGDGRLFLDTADGLLKWIDDTGTVTEVALGTVTGFADPMTTRGDIIYRNSSNVTARLGVGSAGTVLTSDGTDVAWSAAASGSVATDTIWDAAGDLAVGSGANTAAKLPIGTSEQLLASTGSTAAWRHMSNEIAAGQLVNATATGDSGSRAFHFTGNAVPGAFSSEATALGASVVKYSMWAQTLGGGANHQLQAFTPSGAFRIEARLWVSGTTNQNGGGIFVRDSGTGDASGNGALAQYVNNTSGGLSIRILTLDTGTYTARQTSVCVTGSTATPFLPFVYLAIERDGSNNWTAAVSFDRVLWITTASTSKTFTVAKMGTRISNANASWDFIDVVS